MAMFDWFKLSRDSRHKTRNASGRRRPRLEALEPRALLSSDGAASLDLISASTADSKSITITYEASGLRPGESVAFNVFRSAGQTLNAGDQKLGVLTLTGDSLSTGLHETTLPLPGGLPIEPLRPFVLVVADASNALAGASVGGGVASFRTHAIAVVTHGGRQPHGWMRYGPPWQQRMARQLKSEGYDTVIAYNWASQSRSPGSAARQAPILASKIIAAAKRFPANEPVNLHFIGHSEGAIVNSVADVQMMKWSKAVPQLRAGFVKMTMLDPHAANTGARGQQYSVSPGFIGSIYKMAVDRFQSEAKDPLPFVPANVDESDVYFQHTPVAHAQANNDGHYNLWGQVPVSGNARYFDLTAPGVSHAGTFGVQDWYRVNVVPTLGEGAKYFERSALTATEDAAAVATRTRSFQGRAYPGATVRLIVNRAGDDQLAVAGQTTADADGAWRLTTRPLPAGRYQAAATSTTVGAAPSGRTPRMKPIVWFPALEVRRSES